MQCCTTIITISKIFLPPQVETLCPLSNKSPVPHSPPVPGNFSPPFYLYAYSRCFIRVQIIHRLFFCVLLSMFSRFTYVPELHSFSRPNKIPLYVPTTFWSSIHLLMNTWVVSTFCLLCRMLRWTLSQKNIFESLFLTLLGIYIWLPLYITASSNRL